MLANSSFIKYKDQEFSIKFTAQSLSLLDKQQLPAGLTGIPEFDALARRYEVDRINPHFVIPESFSTRDSRNNLQTWYKVRFTNPDSVIDVAAAFEKLSVVDKAEAIPVNHVYKTTDDPQFSNQWHLDQSNDADVDAPEAWDQETGNRSIIVAVMDTGVEWWHQDLAGSFASSADRTSIMGNMWINQAEMNNTDEGVDEDNNGYNDDWVGWDFVTGDPQLFDLGDDYDVEDNDPSDHEGHGTHCAGNVSALNNNNRGVCSSAGGWSEDSNGLGNGVRVMALRIGWSDFPSGRVSMDFAAQAFLYAAQNGANMASCSWGSSSYGPLEDAVNTFLYGTTTPSGSDPKIRLIFVAAGNSSSESNDYLTGRDDCIAVAATKQDDNAATSFTNYGTWVDICAPGEDITSLDKNGGYATWSGTSMATPITASVAALIWSHDISLTAPEVENYLYNGADNIDAHLDSKYIGKMGAGRVNASNSLSLMTAPSNSRPIAVNDSASCPEDSSVVVAVLSNDSDPDNDLLTVSEVMSPQHGLVSNNNPEILYQPQAQYFGPDSFLYVCSDSNGGLDTALVVIEVLPRNDAPQIVNLPSSLFLLANECTALKMSDYASDIDTPYGRLNWQFDVDNPAALSYSYDNGTDSLTICSLGLTGDYFVFFTLSDDSGAFDRDTVTVHVDNPSGLYTTVGQTRTWKLFQNYPNPFNPDTQIKFSVPQAGQVTLTLYNVSGEKITTLYKKNTQPGNYSIKLAAGHLSSGIYFVRMRAGNYSEMIRIVLLR